MPGPARKRTIPNLSPSSLRVEAVTLAAGADAGGASAASTPTYARTAQDRHSLLRTADAPPIVDPVGILAGWGWGWQDGAGLRRRPVLVVASCDPRDRRPKLARTVAPDAKANERLTALGRRPDAGRGVRRGLVCVAVDVPLAPARRGHRLRGGRNARST